MRILAIVVATLTLACARQPSAGATRQAPAAQPSPAAATQTPDLVSVVDVDPTIVVEARYFGNHNFIGRRIDGYEANKCLLARDAAQALARVQAEVRAFGLSLKTYDCYRPQRAVSDFA